MNLSVREMKSRDIELIVDYFLNADSEFLKVLGADESKLPKRTDWIEKLNLEFEKPNEEKEFYYIIWMIDYQPIGHSNINNIEFGHSATMHLHMWKSHTRKRGLGPEFLKHTIPIYFENFKLEKLICEPHAKNIAPNRVLEKIGFEFIKEYETIAGWINLKQFVRRYEMTSKQFKVMEWGEYYVNRY